VGGVAESVCAKHLYRESKRKKSNSQNGSVAPENILWKKVKMERTLEREKNRKGKVKQHSTHQPWSGICCVLWKN